MQSGSYYVSDSGSATYPTSGIWTSYYDPGKNDILYAPSDGGYREVMQVVRSDGKVYATVEDPCGNLMDNVLTFDTSGVVRGIAMDEQGNKIAGVTVSLSGQADQSTNGSGGYNFSNLFIGGRYDMTASTPPGYLIVGSTWCWPNSTDSDTKCPPGHTTAGQNYLGGSSRKGFVPSNGHHTYDTRWIVRPYGEIEGVARDTSGNLTNGVGVSINGTTYTTSTNGGGVKGTFYADQLDARNANNVGTPYTINVSAPTGYRVSSITWCKWNKSDPGDAYAPCRNPANWHVMSNGDTRYLSTPNQVIEMSITLQPVGYVEGVALDESGNRLNGVGVSAQAPNEIAHTGVTGNHTYPRKNWDPSWDGNGTFYLDGVNGNPPPGQINGETYTITSTPPAGKVANGMKYCIWYYSKGWGYKGSGAAGTATCGSGAYTSTAASSVTLNLAADEVIEVTFYFKQAPPPPQLTCVLQTTGAEPFSSFNESLTVSYKNAPANSTITVASPPPFGASFNNSRVVSGASSYVETGPPPNPTVNYPAGVADATYTFTVSIAGFPSATVNCPLVVANVPYFKVYGGDVAVGGGVGATTCPNPDEDAAIKGSVGSDGAGRSVGSGTQFGAFAMKFISGYLTSQYSPYSLGSGTTAANPYPTPTLASSGAYGLAFANTPAGSEGNYGAPPPCNLWVSNLPKGTTPVNGGRPWPISATTVPADGTSTVVYVEDADVYISGNIIYSSAGWTSLSTIPSYELVVYGGNIYIDKGVTQLDGTYVAIPKPQAHAPDYGGTIYTCSTVSAGKYIPVTNTFSGCENQLVVNGAFAAQQVDLQRDCGSLKYSKVTEAPIYAGGSDSTQCTPGVNSSAEVFNFTPETWMRGVSSNNSGTYQAISNMPAVR